MTAENSNDEMVLRIKRKEFTMVPNKVGNTIKNGDAFLLWFYLASKSDNWVIIKSHLCNHFGWSINKLNRLFKVLCGYNLAKCYQEKVSRGRFGKYFIEIFDGEKVVFFDEKTLVEKSKKAKKIKASHRKPKNRKAVAPLSGEKSATKYSTVTKEKEKQNKEWESTTRDLYTHYPTSFFPDDERRGLLTATANKLNMTELELLSKFETLYTGKYKMKKSKDWQQEFEDYLNRELPKKVYEDKLGSRKRYDGQTLHS